MLSATCKNSQFMIFLQYCISITRHLPEAVYMDYTSFHPLPTQYNLSIINLTFCKLAVFYVCQKKTFLNVWNCSLHRGSDGISPDLFRSWPLCNLWHSCSDTCWLDPHNCHRSDTANSDIRPCLQVMWQVMWENKMAACNFSKFPTVNVCGVNLVY